MRRSNLGSPRYRQWLQLYKIIFSSGKGNLEIGLKLERTEGSRLDISSSGCTIACFKGVGNLPDPKHAWIVDQKNKRSHWIKSLFKQEKKEYCQRGCLLAAFHKLHLTVKTVNVGSNWSKAAGHLRIRGFSSNLKWYWLKSRDFVNNVVVKSLQRAEVGTIRVRIRRESQEHLTGTRVYQCY